MGHEELKTIGINAYGHRHKLLKGIEKLLSQHSKQSVVLEEKWSLFWYLRDIVFAIIIFCEMDIITGN